MQHVKNGNEELVCILLLVAGEVPCVCPHEMEQFEGDVGSGHTRIEL